MLHFSLKDDSIYNILIEAYYILPLEKSGDFLEFFCQLKKWSTDQTNTGKN